MNIACPECDTVYRLDPGRIPAAGVVTRCRECGGRFGVPAAPTQAPGEVTAGERVAARRSPDVPIFAPQDTDTRARRLARALVSDIKVYHPERWAQSRSNGTLRQEFRDEILKSWEEYVEQVGDGLAKKTPYFRNALNDILAEGEGVF